MPWQFSGQAAGLLLLSVRLARPKLPRQISPEKSNPSQWTRKHAV